MAKKIEISPEIQASPDYRRASDLLRLLGDVNIQLDQLGVDINEQYKELIGGFVDEVTTLQAEKQTATAELEKMAAVHPEWFEKRQSLKMLAGSLKYHESTELVVADEELTMTLLEREARVSFDKNLHDGKHPLFNAADYIRPKRELNLQALGTLDDETLKRLKIDRRAKNNFKAEPAVVDLGKAVADVTEEKAAAQFAFFYHDQHVIMSVSEKERTS